MLFSVFESQSQQQPAIFFDNAVEAGVQEMFYKQDAVLNTIDSHIYTCGSTLNSNGTYDILITKHNGSNVLIWSVTYSGSGNYNDYAADITFDSSGNVLVCGNSQVSSTDYDALVLKYDSDGDLLWSDTYNGAGSGPDGLTSIITDGSNNVYTCGGAYHSMGELTNLLLIKYDSTGTEQFVKTWNNSSYNLQDGGFRMILSGSYVYCYGATQVSLSPVQWKLASVQYYQSTGNLVGSSTSYGDNDEFTEVKDIMPIGSNNFIVAGYVNVSGQGKNLKVTRFNQELTGTWDYTFNGTANGDDEATSIELSGGWLYVGGYTTLSNGTKDIVVTKRNHTSGSQQWQVALDFEGEDDEAVDLAGNTAGHIYISGNSHKLGNSDYLVAKLNTSTGAVESSNRWSGQAGKEERVSNLVVNEGGEIYVAGQEQLTNGTYRFALTRWSERTVFAPKPTDGYSSHSGYIKNNGQLRNENGTANENIKFYNQSHRVATYINDTLISYQLVQAMDTTDADTTFKVNMTYSKGLSGGKVYPMSQRSEYHNYYLGHMDEPSVQTGIYNTVVKNGVYTNIDAVYTHSPSGFRHWLVARSGSTTSDIEMSFDGQTSLSVDGSGKLIISTTIGNIVYTKAKAYTLNHTTGVMTLLGWQPSYSITGSSVAFTSFGSWSGTLVLEFGEEIVSGMMPPQANANLEWSTFFGNNGLEVNMDVANNVEGEVWYCGLTSAQIFIADPGQNNAVSYLFNDAYIVKFNEDCEAIWITYYGGSDEERAFGIDIDVEGNSYCVGFTRSSNIFNISTDGIDDSSFDGYNEGFYIMLNQSGIILQDSYIGGNGEDTAYDVVYRPFGGGENAAIFIVGQSNDSEGFPIQYSGSALGYDQEHAGDWDGFLMQLNEQGDLVWSTFFGGTYDDYVYGIDCPAGMPTILGYSSNTYSTDNCTEPTDGGFPTCVNTGSWQAEFPYGNFIARFNEKKQLIHSSFIGRSIAGGLHDFQLPSISTAHKVFNPEAKIDYYVCGFTPVSGADFFPFKEWPTSYSNPFYYEFNSFGGGNAYWMAKLEVVGQITTLTGITSLRWQGNISQINVAADSQNGVVVSGHGIIDQPQSVSSYCQNPEDSEFPICGSNGEYYIETNQTTGAIRSFVMKFDEEMGIVWSTQFGNDNQSKSYCVSAVGDYVFIGGESKNSYTLWEFDDTSSDDYYRANILGNDSDANVTRFRLPGAIVGNNETEVYPTNNFLIYPNPATSSIALKLNNQLQNKIRFEVIDAQGRVIIKEQKSLSNGYAELNISELAAGFYLLRILDGINTMQQNFVKQ